MKTALVIATALTLSACASSKPTAQSPADTYFEVGKTTYASVVQVLGEPNDTLRHADGGLSLQYTRSQSRVRTECATEYGKFRGSEVKSDLLTMRFNKQGLLIHYSVVSGRTVTGSGEPGVPLQAAR